MLLRPKEKKPRLGLSTTATSLGRTLGTGKNIPSSLSLTKSASNNGTVAPPTSWLLPCHRNVAVKASQAAADGPIPSSRKMPILSKKSGCPFKMEAKLVVGEDGEIEVLLSEINGHFLHTPGDAEDVKFLPVVGVTYDIVVHASIFLICCRYLKF